LASVDQRIQSLLEELRSEIQAENIMVKTIWMEFKAQLVEVEA
jgi:hypothetical protein